jgi:cell division protein FtsL
MNTYNYEYGTTPRKLKPENQPYKSKKDIQKQIKINEEQRKNAIKLEKRKHNKNVALVVAIFLVLLVISYRSSLINEKFNELQSDKEKLASIEKTNGQLEVSIESSINLNNIEQSAKEQLGMQRLDNDQKVYVTLDKKDYVETSTEDIDVTSDSEDAWYQKIINKIFGK